MANITKPSYTQILTYFFSYSDGYKFWYRYAPFILGILAFVFNAAVLIVLAFAKLNPSRKNYYTFVRSLLAAHCIFGLKEAFYPFYYPSVYGYWGVWSHCIMVMDNTLYFSLHLILGVNVVFLCLDQYIATVKPLRHNSILSTRRCRLMVAIAWILVFSSVFLFRSLRAVYFPLIDLHFNYIMICFTLAFQSTCFTIMCILYGRIIPHIKKQLQMMSQQGGTISMWRKQRAFVTLTFIFLTYFMFALVPSLAWFALYLTVLRMTGDNETSVENIINLLDVFAPLIFLNSISDPLIYAIRMKEIRKHFANKCKLSFVRRWMSDSRRQTLTSEYSVSFRTTTTSDL